MSCIFVFRYEAAEFLLADFVVFDFLQILFPCFYGVPGHGIVEAESDGLHWFSKSQ